MEKWRRLRGQYYTEFLKEAKEEIHRHGKKLQLHMFDMMEGAPDKSTMMEIYFDWRSWLEQGIPDEVTLKNFHSNPHKIHFGR